MTTLFDNLKQRYSQALENEDKDFTSYLLEGFAEEIQEEIKNDEKKSINQIIKGVIQNRKGKNNIQIEKLKADYARNKDYYNKYELDGIWMDIGGLTYENEILDKLLEVSNNF